MKKESKLKSIIKGSIHILQGVRVHILQVKSLFAIKLKNVHTDSNKRYIREVLKSVKNCFC